MESLEEIERLFTEGVREAGERTRTAGVETNTKTKRKYSVEQSRDKITVGMSDRDRTQILQSKKIIAPIYTGQADQLILVNKDDLESGQRGLVKAAIVRIGDELGVFADYNISDVDVMITLSKGNLRESISKDATPTQIAKLLPVLKQAVENAIGIESHDNRYYYDTVTVRFDNLMGGFIDGEYFVPVRFGLKQSVDGHIALYVVVDQNKIDLEKIRNKKTEVIKAASPHEVESSTSRSVSYSISQIIPFVNSVDILRYMPDDMLTNEQKNVKYQGIADTIRYTNEKNDRKYSKYISENKLDAAKQMVRLAALANGYIFQQSETEREGIWIHSETGQVKLGAVITYDNNGNVIPLSERFKEDDSDIRYSIDETPETPDASENRDLTVSFCSDRESK